MYCDYRCIEDEGFYYGKSKKVYNIYHYMYDLDNLTYCANRAQKGKQNPYIDDFNEHIIENLDALYHALKDETYQHGGYSIRKIYEPKERTLKIAKFNPDRVVHHLIVRILEPLWVSIMIPTTFSCIKHRGIHACADKVYADMMADVEGTKYALSIDIKKYYDHIVHSILKRILRKRIGDKRMLRLLDKIIDSIPGGVGVPIGNYTSQFFGNLYLTYFDHFCKEVLKCKYYYRYMDNIVVLDGSKERLHEILDKMALYLGAELHLEIKDNWQIFPVDARGLDFVGYRQWHGQRMLRKSILRRFQRKFNRMRPYIEIKDERDFKHTFSSEYGWIMRCNTTHQRNLINNCITKRLNHEKELDSHHRHPGRRATRHLPQPQRRPRRLRLQTQHSGG